MGREKRNLLLHVNRFQKIILYPIVISCLVACSIAFLCLMYFNIMKSEQTTTIREYYQEGQLVSKQAIRMGQEVAIDKTTGLVIPSESHEKLKKLIPFLISLIPITLFFVIYWTFYVSNKLVGPYERIINDMDDLIAGKRSGPLSTRDGDEMFDELLKRVNRLIEKMKK